MTDSTKIVDEHDDDWFDDNKVTDAEKIEYLDSLKWEPVQNLSSPDTKPGLK